MRWQQLFGDLQAQFEAEETAAEQAESASRARAEVGALGIGDRLRGALGFPLVLGCLGAGPVAGVLVGVGARPADGRRGVGRAGPSAPGSASRATGPGA